MFTINKSHKNITMETIDTYWKKGFNEVEGWLSEGIIHPLKAISEFQIGRNIEGGILEIGVHHGRLLIALALLSRESETTVGIDVFDSQHLNIDHSGYGNYQIAYDNIKKYCNPSNKVELITKDSLSINTLEIHKLIEDYGPFRIIGIDGGHTAEHTYNDLIIAQNTLQSGGVVILDDYYNMHWPGVHEGAARYFISTCSKLKPFCYSQNKLFLSDYTFHDSYLTIFKKSFKKENNYKPVVMWGADVIAY